MSKETAADKLEKAYNDLNQAVIKAQTRTGVGDAEGFVSQDDALTLLDGSPELEEWEKAHPNVSINRVARAYNTSRDLTQGLNEFMDDLDEDAAEKNDLLSRIGQELSPSEILELDDDSVSKIETLSKINSKDVF